MEGGAVRWKAILRNEGKGPFGKDAVIVLKLDGTALAVCVKLSFERMILVSLVIGSERGKASIGVDFWIGKILEFLAYST